LLPETAGAYFLRAMTALTVQEQLTALDKALQLDPSHYESLRLRAFTYYASRKYDRLREDARVMTVLRPRDPLGHSLRAMAWRASGRYTEAIADYDRALVLTPRDDPATPSPPGAPKLSGDAGLRRVLAEAAVRRTWLARGTIFGADGPGGLREGDNLFRQIIARPRAPQVQDGA
jgi:tetratricopeptide (TPR) repeat protein